MIKKTKLLRLSLGALLISFVHSLNANANNPMQQQFDQTGAAYQNYSKQLIQSGKLNNQFNPQDYAKGDINNIPEKQYANDPAAMEKAKSQAFQKNEYAQSVQYANNNNKTTINPKNPAYKKALAHQNNAEQILGDSGDNMQCVEVEGNCTTHTTTQRCQQSNYQYLNCFKYPQVQIVETIIDGEVISFSGSSRMNYINANTYRVSLPIPQSGTLKSLKVTFSYTSPILGYFGRYSITFAPVFSGMVKNGNSKRSWTTSYDHLTTPLTQGQHFTIGITSLNNWVFGEQVVSYEANLQLPSKIHRKAIVTWHNSCNNIDKDACVKTYEQCSEAGGTRNIGGVNVTLPCWKYDQKYKCGFNKLDSCKVFEDKCNFVSQRCIEQLGGFCMTYEKTYSCIEQSCEDKELICGNPNTIRFKQLIKRGTAEDFLKAISGLAGTVEAGKDVKKNQDQLQIFKGEVKDCGEAAAGLYDCCDGGGNILKQCSDQEKALKKAKDKRLATFAGRYCAKKVLGVCLVYHQTWCVFGSKISRILQEQGRRDQLGIGFGSGEHPNCAGITPTQLQQLDFKRIDFKEIYDDIQNQATLPTDALANTLDNKFGSGNSLPEINQHQNNQLPSKPNNGN
ncbi:conjugal transfer protein TraN [Cysteiniphilum marinum]|uniref:conjugal transfer protein TraN n=1 Tax=Cysteiniphilum marinum TaxID=2774191 RepID=UPI00193BF58B|nr:conjugal transfer protein TraN [Cysteiniphilum marinum]